MNRHVASDLTEEASDKAIATERITNTDIKRPHILYHPQKGRFYESIAVQELHGPVAALAELLLTAID
jgi:hypothetical protein